MNTVTGVYCPYWGAIPAYEAPADLGPEAHVCEVGCGGVFDRDDLRERWWE